jgi:hypothetical protein
MISWDFFDTLMGRAAGHDPWRVFEAVGGPSYVPIRQEAERRSDKTWKGIFEKVREITGWSAGRVDTLARDEWSVELRGAFPIVENVSRVRPGDRIVSDTYFSTLQVRELADRIGIPATVDIVTAWDAKWTGRWWRSETARQAKTHIGDNQRSDLEQPRAAGLKAERYAGGRPTLAEQAWERAGLWEIAAAARAARLQNPHPAGSDEARWWNGAAAANVPFLLTAAALVHEYAATACAERVMFVSRDAILLAMVYETVYGHPAGVFHASRETLRRPSEQFVRYARAMAKGALFVDLHGTGRTVAEFEKRTGIRIPYVFVCGQRRLAAHAPALTTLRGIGAGTAVEVMNYHDEGRVIDVVDGRPVRAPLEYDPAIVRIHRAATLAGALRVCRRPRGVTAEHVLQAAAAVAKAVPKELLRQHEVEHRARA